MRIRAARALWGLLLLTALDSTGCLQVTVKPEIDTTVTVSTALPLDQCAVCTVDDGVTCHTSVTLIPEKEQKLLLNCTQPIESSYAVTIAHTLECTKDACNPTTVEGQGYILPELSRTFTWELKAPEKTVVSLNVLGDGLVQMSQPCTGGIQYSVATSKTSTQEPTRYCRGGSLTHLELSDQAVVSLLASANAQVDPVLFHASAGPLKGRTMIVSVDSSTTVVLNRDLQGPECEVCTGSPPDCSSKEKTLTNVEKLSVEFSCKTPEDVFSVKINKNKMECTLSSCVPATAEVDPDLFKDFKRTVSWDIGTSERTALELIFSDDGLTYISEDEICQDGYRYTLSTTAGKTYDLCKGGTMSHVVLPNPGAVTVTADIPKGGDVDKTVFSVEATRIVGRMMSVSPDPNTIITISRMTQEPDCSVCIEEAPNQKCNPQFMQLRDPRNTSMEFTCPNPQDVFTVEINREIDCTDSSCSGDIVQAETSLFPDFNRTFTWDVKVVATHAFQVDFPEPGMRQISNEETCPDEHTYSLIVYVRTGPVKIGTFCKGGIVTSIFARYKGRVSLQVPGNAKLNPVNFKLKVGPETNKLAIVKVNLPRGVSQTEFITPNYPRDFPDIQQMQWDFTVPGMHNYSMQFVDYTEPECLNGDLAVEYEKVDKKTTTLALTDPQPEHQQGNFKMLLKNCETNTTLQGLTLKYKVSLMRSGHPVLCTVDLTKHKGVSVHLEKIGSDPYCEMSVNSEIKEKISVASGSTAKLSFLDCPVEDVRLTASNVMECQNVALCPPSVLTIPTLDSCLRMPLHNFTWHINIPQSGTVDLVSPTGTLRQSVPGQKCKQAPLMHVAEGDGFPIGDFCNNGTLQKVQVHANVSITVSAPSKVKGPFLNVSIGQEIPETIIYRVSPNPVRPTLLATPNWPQGMKPFSTVSWIIDVPSQHKAHLQFVNVSQPKCKDRHTAISVKLLGSEEEMMSRREDQQVEDMLVPGSFFLNASNCIIEDGHFGTVAKVTLQKSSNLLAIALGIAGAVLLALIVLGLVCFLTKKKQKEKKNKESSIYIGHGSFRSGDRYFAKTRSDNESHVYDSIDDTMVYGHLLPNSSYADSMSDNYKGNQTDSYHTFTGTANKTMPIIKEPDPEPEMDGFSSFLSPSDSFMPPRPRTPISRQDSLGFQDSRMVDNELYTFKSTGDINTIRLSGANMEPQPTVTMTEDSL